MAVIAIAAFGTLGDVFPFLQLGIDLQKRGHRVRFASSKLYQHKIEELNFSYYHLRPDLSDLNETVADLGAKLMDPKHGAEYMYRKLLIPNINENFEDVFCLSEGADILISHPLVLSASLVAEKRSIKWVSVVLSPISMMSAYDASVLQVGRFTETVRRSPRICKMIIKLIKGRLSFWHKPIDKLRIKLSLPPNPNPLFEGQHSKLLSLALFSSTFAARQKDWPEQVKITGFVYNDIDEPDEDADDELKTFLQAGEAPIVFTLGSSAVFKSGNFYEETIKCIEILKCRAVVLTGLNASQSVSRLNIGKNVHIADYASFGLLFKYASVIVHHGGVGTTAQVLRAGVPSLVVPHGHDQPDNAMRVKRMGLAEVILPQNYQANHVARLLNKIQIDRSYKTKAEEIAKKIRSENGIKQACNIIESLF